MVIPAGMGNVGDAQAIGIRAHEFTTERTESDGETCISGLQTGSERGFI